MSHENARSGVSKIFTSQILKIVMYVCMVIAGALMIIAMAGASVESAAALLGAGIPAILLLVAGFVFGIISFIMYIVGLSKAGKDSEKIHKAFILYIVSIVIAIVVGIVAPLVAPATSQWLLNLTNLIIEIFGLVIVYNVLFGCAEVNPELTEKAASVWKVYLIVIILGITASVLAIIFGILGATVISGTLFLIIFIADYILSIIGFIMYLVFLNVAKKTL